MNKFKIIPELLSVQINLTNYCVWRCQFCQKHSWPREHLDYNIFESLLRDLDPDKTTIILSGGEPSLYPEIEEAICALNALDFKWGMFTSGVGWKNNIIDELTQAEWIRMSILSDDPFVSRKLTNCDSFVEQHLFLHDLKEADANVIGECVCVPENKNALPTIGRWGIPFFYYDAHDTGENVEKTLVGDRNEPYIIPFFHCLIDPSGKVYADCSLYSDNDDYESGRELRARFCLGDLHNFTLNEIFYSEYANDIRKSLLHFYKNNYHLRQRTERYAQKNRLIYDFLKKQLFL